MIHRFEVDGVPALHAPRPGRTTAGLVFRVGSADETLARSGITHLVEHLALHRSGVQVHRFNGATGQLHTHFLLEGDDHEIRAFLQSVCESLTALPVDRLETEKAILRTEEAGRGTGAAEATGLWRYGAQGHGLVSYPEWGVPGVDPQTVQHWADTWFTRDNAALWIAGERVPDGLQLPLHPGRRMPPPQPTSALPVTPAYFAAGQRQVLFETLLPRTAAADLYTACLDRELFQDLRQDGGLSYTAGADHADRGDGVLTVTALADALPEEQDAVLGGFVDVLARLAVAGVDPDTLDALRRRADAAHTAPDADPARLPGCAADLLLDLPVRTRDELRAELAAVTAEDVRTTAQQALGSGLLRVPAGRRADWAGYTAAPLHSTAAVEGSRHRSREPGGPDLVIGRAGVSLVREGEAATVRYDACAAFLAWPDGGRRLIGADGICVEIEPACFAVDAHALASIDAAVPHQAYVRMPPRTAPARPSRPGPAAAPAAAVRSSPAQLAVNMVLMLVAGLFLLFALGGALGADDESRGDPVYWGVLVVAAGIAAALLRSVWRRSRPRRT
ncbi:insulinase family protein [Streptomyces sp. NRRL B-24484]|uniref:insulinase family protein n=1 Tax=Streptomyces sp. NRRL B-24484 TaxID=1463833 RepID=UPI0004C14569|nr:insulinase family protein [Streptomyces sp. NRRL B-24484]